MDSNPGKTSTENIDEVILRLLKLKTGTELDYQTYAKKIKIKLASSRMVGAFIPAEEDILLREEFKRVRNKEGRFVILKSKKTKVSSPPPPPRSGGGGGSPPKTGSIVKAPPAGKITTEKLFNTPRVEPVNVRDITPDKSSQVDPLIRISNLLDSILETLTNINNFDREQATRQRTDAENRRRGQRESELESKPFEGIKKALSAITKPFQSIWDRIVNFITNVIFGRIVIKLLEWFGDPKNQEKIQSIIRFLGDHWPTLLALYLRFGTGIGRFVGKLGGILVKGAFKLVGLAAKLAVKAGIGKAGGKLSKVAGFLGGTKGKLLSAGLGIAADVAVTAGTSAAIDKFSGGGGEKTSPVQKFSGGGAVRIPKFAGGGFANFGNMFKGAGMGSMFGPMGMLAGAALGSGKPQEMFNGFVSGQSGVDKVPAMLTDGEFVMSTGAVQKYGVDTLEAMNAAGGGTNQPKVVNGTAHAYGGGLIGSESKRNLSFSKDPAGAIRRFIEYKFGVKLNNPSSWGPKESGSSLMGTSPQSSLSTGSLLSNPMGAINRIASRVGTVGSSTKTPTTPGAGLSNLLSKKAQSLSNLSGTIKSKLNMDKKSSGSKKGGFFEDLKSSTFRDAGSIYAKQMLGGRGGPVSERDLGKESKQELQNAIKRAKKRTGSEIRKVESEIAKLKGMGAKDGNPALERQKSFLKKLKSGGIRVQYADYADEKGNMSESAKNSKNILGQFWATERSKKEGGGYRVEDKYDFDTFKKKVKDPKTGKMVEKDLDQGELFRDVLLGKGKTTQQRLQAAHLLNPFRGKGDVDMVLGGKRTAAESMGLTGSKTLLGGMLGISGKPKDKNTKALEAKRPWWDKSGWFGGGSRVAQQQKAKAQVSKPSKPKTPVKPLPRPKPKPIVAGGGSGGRRGSGSKPSSGSNSPSFNAQHSKGTRTHKETLGIMR